MHYTINSFDEQTQTGHMIAITTVQVENAFAFFWNSQMVYKDKAEPGEIFQTWFSPMWLQDTSKYANLMCVD